MKHNACDLIQGLVNYGAIEASVKVFDSVFCRSRRMQTPDAYDFCFHCL